MPRWYIGFSCYGRPQNVIDQIAARVSQSHLGKLVPVARVEKKARGGQFYLFLAVDSPEIGEIPPEVQDGVLTLRSLSSRLAQPFTFGEIRSMVSGELDVHDYAQRLAYWRPSDLPEEDPFGGSALHWQSAAAAAVSEEQSAAYDRFLLWLSAVGRGSWELFRDACHVCIAGSEEEALATRTIRQLRLLGHMEAAEDGKRWCIAPPVVALANDPAEGEYAFFCGQRDPTTIAALDGQGGHELVPPEGGSGPRLIRWRKAPRGDTDVPVLNVAVQLASALPRITDWVAKRTGVQGIIPPLYRVKQFNGDDFVDVTFDAQPGLYQFWPLEEGPDRRRSNGRPQLTAFYDAPRDRWLRGDWYGLRFLARLANGEQCAVRYDTRTRRLAVPRDWRWPELYERALVLASGRMPTGSGDWLIYRAVAPDTLEMLAQKLELRLEEDDPNA